MSIILQFIIWAGLQVGVPVCDIDLTEDECRTLEQTAGDNIQRIVPYIMIHDYGAL